MDAKTLKAAVPGLPDARAALWAQPITDVFAEFAINTPRRQSAFLAQVGHECASFGHLVESLNYTPAALLATFPTHVTSADAQRLGRQPGETTVPPDRQAAVGDLVYGGRLGNSLSGDGYRYRGRGGIGVTGKDNYRACGTALGLDLIAHPEILETLPAAVRAAGWFWRTHGCNELADSLEFTKLTRVINGGIVGLDDRVSRWTVAREVLGA